MCERRSSGPPKRAARRWGATGVIALAVAMSPMMSDLALGQAPQGRGAAPQAPTGTAPQAPAGAGQAPAGGRAGAPQAPAGGAPQGGRASRAGGGGGGGLGGGNAGAFTPAADAKDLKS